MSNFGDLSIDGARVIGARVAMRAVPLLPINKISDPDGEYALSMFRAVSSGWIAARFPDIGSHAHASAAIGGASKSDVGLIRAAALAMTASAANSMSPGIVKAAQIGIEAISSACRQLAGEIAKTDLNLAMKDDFDKLHESSSAVVATLPLWPDVVPPDWAIQRWNNLARDLTSLGLSWEPWVNWYKKRLAGGALSDECEFSYVDVPNDLWAREPARANAWIMKSIQERETTSDKLAPLESSDGDIPQIPNPGPGPRFRVSEYGRIERAPPSDLDEWGNDIRIVNQLRPLVQKSVADLRTRISRNEFPELLNSVEQYENTLNAGSDRPINWGELWGLGVMIQNAALAAERQIAERLLPALEDPVKAALDSLLALHGPLILATSEGARLSAAAQEFGMTRQQQADLRASSEQISERLSREHEIISPQAAKSIASAIHAIGEGSHPERGSVYALATIKNLSIILLGGAAAATPAVIGALLGSALLGVVLGAPITLVAVETVKKNPAFNALVTQLGAKLDQMSDVEFRSWLEDRGRRLAPFRSFVISNEDNLRRIAESTIELRWMLKYIDFIVRDKS
jgi:hypothetical protein